MFKAENIFDWFKNVPVVRGHILNVFGLQRYLEASKTSKMEVSVKTATAFGVNHCCKKLHLRCLAGFGKCL